MIKRSYLPIIAVLALSLAVVPLAQAADSAAHTVEKSRIVVESMLSSHDKGIPADLLKECAGVAIVPALYKGGLIVGGSLGSGIVMKHDGNGWSPPAFFKFGMASVGLQIGVQKIELIMVIMGQPAMKAFLKSKFKLGADVAVAAGPVGARSSAATEINLKGGIYSYSRAKGLFAGFSLEGGGIDATPDKNKEYYRTTSRTSDILAGKVSVPPEAQALIRLLDKYHD